MIKSLLILLFFSATTQAYFVEQIIGKDNCSDTPFSAEYSSCFPEKNIDMTGLLIWQRTNYNLLIRDITYPDSLNIGNRSLSLGIHLPTKAGQFNLIIEEFVEDNTALTSIENDSLIFKSRMKFQNKKEQFTVSYSNDFLNKKFKIKTTLMPVLWNRPYLLRDPRPYLDINASLYVTYRLFNSSDIRFSGGRNYYDKKFTMDVLGIVSNDIWLHNISIGKAFKINYRNYLSIDQFKIGLKHQFTDNLETAYSFNNNRYTTLGIFPLDDWLYLNIESYKNTISLEYNLPNTSKIHVNAFHGIFAGNFIAKYLRENGSYSSVLPDINTKGNSSGAEADCGIFINKSHMVSAGTELSYQTYSVPDYATFDPVKYLGISYGTKRIKGKINSFKLNLETGYQYSTKRNTLKTNIGYIRNGFSGLAFLKDTWTLENDTINMPVKKTESIEIHIQNQFKFLKKYTLDSSINQIIPFRIQYDKETEEAMKRQDTEKKKKRKIIGLLRFGITLIYGLF